MNKKIVIYALIITLSGTIKASEKTEKQINCDELAQHIQGKMNTENPGAVYFQDNGILAVAHRRYPDGASCSLAGHGLIEDLSRTNAMFTKYRNALLHCMQGKTSYPVATKTAAYLEEKLRLGNQCIEERNVAEKARAEQSERTERKRREFEKYLDDHSS